MELSGHLADLGIATGAEREELEWQEQVECLLVINIEFDVFLFYGNYIEYLVILLFFVVQSSV
jgi:hypothetical protein